MDLSEFTEGEIQLMSLPLDSGCFKFIPGTARLYLRLMEMQDAEIALLIRTGYGETEARALLGLANGGKHYNPVHVCTIFTLRYLATPRDVRTMLMDVAEVKIFKAGIKAENLTAAFDAFQKNINDAIAKLRQSLGA